MTGTTSRRINKSDQRGVVMAGSTAMAAAVHRNRWTALAIAGAAGFVAGWMTALVLPRGSDNAGLRCQRPLGDAAYLTQGEHEPAARETATREWFDQLQAPTKEWILVEESGQLPQVEQFPRFRTEPAVVRTNG